MKNLIQLTTNAKCFECSSGFVCFTPNGGDYLSCPCCDNSTEVDDDSDQGNLSYCPDCRILFSIGCVHAENGCTDSAYNGHFIGKWKYDGEIYVGMPQFDNIEEMREKMQHIEILEYVCVNNGLLSKKHISAILFHVQACQS